ncbi:zinc ribbon domain-containing protein [candidate division KSB1 bacterium]|nr:zinc ribbon domain-containing protein [candidate division KSB1 bacterium]
MPTFEYRCQDCHHHFESFHGINADPVTECPQCQGPVMKLITGGSGFLMGSSTPDHAPCCGKPDRCEPDPRACGGCCGGQ